MHTFLIIRAGGWNRLERLQVGIPLWNTTGPAWNAAELLRGGGQALLCAHRGSWNAILFEPPPLDGFWTAARCGCYIATKPEHLVSSIPDALPSPRLNANNATSSPVLFLRFSSVSGDGQDASCNERASSGMLTLAGTGWVTCLLACRRVRAQTRTTDSGTTG